MAAALPIAVDLLPAATLGRADVDAWLAIQAAQPVFANPLLGPGFAMAVGRVREDARVAVFRRAGRPVGFFAHHRRPGGFGRPIGAPFSDYHAVVAAPDAFAADDDILVLSGLKAFRHSGLIDPHGVFPTAGQVHEAFSIELEGSAEAFLEARRAASPKKFKNYRRLQHRLIEIGPLSIRSTDDASVLADLLRWKSEQFVRTGTQDVLRPAWVGALMQDLFATREATPATGLMTGLMLTLHAGDRLVGGHFGIRQGDVYHPWIASMDPDLAPYSPGNAFLDQVIRAMPGLGLRVYDLGVGHDHYKRPYVSTIRQVSGGLQSAPGGAGVLSRAGDGAWRMGGLGRSGAIDKVRRRLDHIATVDPSIRGRMHGLMEAVAATRRRSLTGEN